MGYFGNIVALRDRMKGVIGGVPFIWCVLMKHFIPHVLIILFINLAQTKNEDGKPKLGNYGEYRSPYQVMGCLVVAFTLVLFLVGVFLPNLYAPLALPQTEEAKQELEKYAAGGVDMTTTAQVDFLQETPEEPKDTQFV